MVSRKSQEPNRLLEWSEADLKTNEIFDEILRQRAEQSPFYQLLGMKIEKLSEGQSVFSIDIEQKHHNIAGISHGGVIASVADASMGVALATMTDPKKERPVTVEIKVNYLSPVHRGRLESVGKICHKGNTVAVGTCEVKNIDDGSVAAIATATFVIKKISDSKEISNSKEKPQD